MIGTDIETGKIWQRRIDLIDRFFEKNNIDQNDLVSRNRDNETETFYV